MDYEIEPRPEPEEREAIVTALERLLKRDNAPTAYRSGWREEGVRENLDEDDQAGTRPRSSPGATRA